MSRKSRMEERCSCFRDAIKAYRNKHGLTQEGLANRIFVSKSTIKNWERNVSSEPKLRDVYEMMESLRKAGDSNLTFDELLTGIATPDIDARSRTGLSDTAISNLAQINDEHKKTEWCEEPNTPHRDMLPFIDALLSDSSFLRDIEWRIHRLVCLKAEYNQYGEFEDVGDKDLADGIAFAISRAFLDKVDGYVESAIENEGRRIMRRDLVDMAASIQAEANHRDSEEE